MSHKKYGLCNLAKAVRILVWALLIAEARLAWSQSTIVYCDGPAFQTPSTVFTAGPIDLDQNGSADLNFSSGNMICTMDVPCSYCGMPFYVTSTGTNAFLVQGYDASILSAGESIGSTTPTNSGWSGGATAMLLNFWFSPRDGTSGATGPLAAMGDGYLGVRFYALDGLHYGWVHLRWTEVLEWAYETRPGTPIKAGAKPVPVPLVPPEVARPGYLRLKFATEVGRTYQVQAKDRLDTLAWTNLSFALPASAAQMMVDLPMQSPAQFFRIVEAD